MYQSLLDGEQRIISQPAGAGPPVDVRVLSAAATPAFPSSPNTKVATSSGGVGGIVIGLLLTLVRNRNQHVLSIVDEVTETTGLPVMALTLSRRGKQTVLAAARADPTGEVAEGLRLLRAHLQERGQSSATRSVLFVAVDGEKPRLKLPPPSPSPTSRRAMARKWCWRKATCVSRAWRRCLACSRTVCSRCWRAKQTGVTCCCVTVRCSLTFWSLNKRRQGRMHC